MSTVVIVPGLGDSGPAHWQSIWQSDLEGASRVRQENWDSPELDTWLAALDDAISLATGRVVLVAHSLGCILVAHWASRADASIVSGALLVGPPDVESAVAIREIAGFAPVPRIVLPFRSVVIASENDEFVTIERAAEFAESWGSSFVNAGRLGHMNTGSSLGSWPLGRAALAELQRHS
jgi:predicted alpha/beta hydrolase family esterase